MATEQLKIVLTAETKQAQKQLEDFIKTTQGVSKVMPQVAKSVGGANVALVNFGRVVQDAPFGLIGIANNIDPLIGSFQSLKAETGSASAAFKALGGALLGPAGIAIGVSAVTSLLIAFGDKLFKSKDAASETEKALTSLANSTAKELIDFQAAVSFAQDATKSYDERKKAVASLKQEYPEYLKAVSDEAILNGKAAAALDKVTESILRQAVIKSLKDDIDELVGATAKQIIAIEKARAATRSQAEEEQRLQAVKKQGKTAFDAAALAQLQAGNAASDASNGFSKLSLAAEKAAARTPTKQIEALKLQLVESVKPLVDIAETFKDIGGAGGENAGKKIDNISKGFKTASDNAKELLAVAEQAFFITGGQDNTPIQAAPAIDEGPVKTLQEILSGTDFGKAVENTGKIKDNTSDIVVGFQLLSPLIDQSFNALANGENAFQSLIQGVKRLIIELIKAAALAAILAAVTGGASGAGFNGAKGFGAIFASLLGFGKRAGGGPVAGGSPYLVGENGPELFVPGASGRVVSNNMLAGGGSLVARVSGNDLLFLMQKAGNNRNAWR